MPATSRQYSIARVGRPAQCFLRLNRSSSTAASSCPSLIQRSRRIAVVRVNPQNVQTHDPSFDPESDERRGDNNQTSSRILHQPELNVKSQPPPLLASDNRFQVFSGSPRTEAQDGLEQDLAAQPRFGKGWQGQPDQSQ
jgi:hypothetical protein